MGARWRQLAFAARYGHQPLNVLLGGRMPTELEIDLFCRGVDYWLRAENDAGSDGPTTTDE